MRVIDLMHLGRARVIGCWQVGDVLVDPGPTSCLPTLLEALGDERPSALLLTHIHFDHAGASGSLVERWPDLRVYVHERGAKHMMDPERLYNSARRLYGDDMERLWGEMLPVPEENLEILSGGETIRDGAYKVAYTPGHASHHVSYLHDGTAFVGDVGGVRITPESMTIPPTPPPDVDVEAWHESIALVRGVATAAAGHDPLRVKRGRRSRNSTSSMAGSTHGRRSRVTPGTTRSSSDVQAEIQRDGSLEQAADLRTGRPRGAAIRRI